MVFVKEKALWRTRVLEGIMYFQLSQRLYTDGILKDIFPEAENVYIAFIIPLLEKLFSGMELCFSWYN